MFSASEVERMDSEQVANLLNWAVDMISHFEEGSKKPLEEILEHLKEAGKVMQEKMGDKNPYGTFSRHEEIHGGSRSSW